MQKAKIFKAITAAIILTSNAAYANKAAELMEHCVVTDKNGKYNQSWQG